MAEHIEQLDEWFWVQGQTLAAVRERLAEVGCPVSLSWLSQWRAAREWELRRQQLLNQIAAGARQCGQLEKERGWNGPANVEILIALHRVLILQLSSQSFYNPDAIRRVTEMMRAVLNGRVTNAKSNRHSVTSNQ